MYSPILLFEIIVSLKLQIFLNGDCLFFVVSSYFKSKLRGLYKTAGTDAETEVEWVISNIMSHKEF